jgi:hypothetical protein
MTLAGRLAEYVRACFPGIWVESFEHDDAVAEIDRLCREHGWTFAAWDVDRGLVVPGRDSKLTTQAGPSDPLAPLRTLIGLAEGSDTTILVLRNFHRFLGSAEVVQALDSTIAAGKQNRCFVVVLAPVVKIPIELERQFVVLTHDLPGRDQLEAIARAVATEPGELPEEEALGPVLDAAAGLTRIEAEGAFALSLVRHGRLAPDALWELKAGALRKAGLLTLHRGGESFAHLGGLDALKSFCTRALRPGVRPGARARGILLLGPPGSGKSAIARALGNETGRPTLVLDVGALMGSLVGATEANVRQALWSIDAMAPCVCMIDEVEKALAGATAGSTDSGVSARLFGTILSWMNDRESDVFVVCTSNDVSRLPPEFSRAERMDAIFFLDLPSAAERESIWRIHLAAFGLDPEQRRPADGEFTGAEIRACCRLAALLDVPLVEAATNIVPVAITAGESVERLRGWASGRCLAADRPGIYHRSADLTTAAGRAVRRGPSLN